MNAYAMSSSSSAAHVWYSYTLRRVAFFTRSTTAATPPTLSGMSTKKERQNVRLCLPCPEKTPPVQRELSTPRSVAMSAAGRTRAPFLATAASEVVRPATRSVNGATAATTAARTPNATAVASQKLFRAASPSPRPRWNPTRTAMTMENIALTAPLHITVAVDTAAVAATASTPRRETNNVVAWPTAAPNTRVPTSGTACFRNSSVRRLVWCSNRQPPSGQYPRCAFLYTNMYRKYVSGCRHRESDRLTAAPTNPSPSQRLVASKNRNGPPNTNTQLSNALTKRNTTPLTIAGRGLPIAWK
mmetsp:Transcript_9680/g.41098  ORF Transcript_9680/g.41098 Transcript_9680/m.41098 type:complete len:301 (-) Transcript_9680:946-1848(-)